MQPSRTSTILKEALAFALLPVEMVAGWWMMQPQLPPHSSPLHDFTRLSRMCWHCIEPAIMF